MVVHALDSTANGATQLQIHPLDTDVFENRFITVEPVYDGHPRD